MGICYMKYIVLCVWQPLYKSYLTLTNIEKHEVGLLFFISIVLTSDMTPGLQTGNFKGKSDFFLFNENPFKFCSYTVSEINFMSLVCLLGFCFGSKTELLQLL